MPSLSTEASKKLGALGGATVVVALGIIGVASYRGLVVVRDAASARAAAPSWRASTPGRKGLS